jgi:hypothetical protein
MKKLTGLKIAILGSFVNATAWAGWVSGGGGLIKDSMNPWFIQNTKHVSYCVLESPQFSLDTAKAKVHIKNAFKFWTKEFSRGQTIFEPRIEVATQTFTEVSCPTNLNDVEIVFQLGHIAPDQLEYLEGGDFGAVSVRTRYNRQTLSGGGFIYFSPDTNNSAQLPDDIVERPWSFNDGSLFYWTVVHELSHVFGIPHSNNRGAEGNVTAYDFVDNILKKFNAWRFKTNLIVNPVFRAPNDFVSGPNYCRTSPADLYYLLKDFLGASRDKCLEIKVSESGIKTFESVNGRLKPIGEAIVDRKKRKSFTLISNAIHFWLPKEQTVFDNLVNGRINTPGYYRDQATATYRTYNGLIERQVTVAFDPTTNSPLGDDFKLGGIYQGKLYYNLVEGI